MTTKQEWKLAQIRKESNFLWMNEALGEEVLAMGMKGSSDNEITWALWKKEGAEKFGISPEAIGSYLKERGLDSRTRKAIKFVPLSNTAQNTIEKSMTSADEQVALKASMWVQEKLNPDFEYKGAGTVNVNTTNNHTAIQINIKEEEEDLSYLLADVEDVSA